MDGVAMVQHMQKSKNTPVIYLTSNTDDQTFNRAKETDPHAFLSKPFNKLDLQRAIELTIERINKQGSQTELKSDSSDTYVLTDSLFVKHKDSMVKVVINDVLYIEAERSYCRIYTKEREFLLTMPLKEMEQKLPPPYFLRVHRSFIVNLAHIDEVSNNNIIVAGKVVPLTKDRRSELMKRLQTL
jgi:DNA-binding LytR/AlgR family response regulator